MDFNWPRLSCHPKKLAGCIRLSGSTTCPEYVRPLSVVNTDNWVVTAAVKYTLRDYLEAWVPIHQK